MDRKKFTLNIEVMKQILVNITKNEQGKSTIIYNLTNNDDVNLNNAIPPALQTEKDVKFLSDLESLLNEYTK